MWITEKKQATSSATFLFCLDITCKFAQLHISAWMSLSDACWPSWVYRSCKHLLLPVSRQHGSPPQSCEPTWVQKLEDPKEHCTNSEGPPHLILPLQTLPSANVWWQPDDGHAEGFLPRSSSGKLATQHLRGQHTKNGPKENKINF